MATATRLPQRGEQWLGDEPLTGKRQRAGEHWFADEPEVAEEPEGPDESDELEQQQVADERQVRRDRLTASLVVVLVAVLMGLLAWLATLGGGPQTMDLHNWMIH